MPAPASAPLPQQIQFNRDIRPILSENCFTCHGPDKTHRTTVFHFDVEESAKQDLGNSHCAIFPGDLEKSAMVERITAADEKRRIPPIATGRKLSERQIALLKEWIKQGAPWEKHWSFQAPKRPDPPKVANAAWVRNPIDNFILHRLEQEGMKPSPEADRATLLRRVSLDLTGKGPTLGETDAFVADKSANAYEKVVDRLLQSPHYGERMALPWLDAARLRVRCSDCRAEAPSGRTRCSPCRSRNTTDPTAQSRIARPDGSAEESRCWAGSGRAGCRVRRSFRHRPQRRSRSPTAWPIRPA